MGFVSEVELCVCVADPQSRTKAPCSLVTSQTPRRFAKETQLFVKKSQNLPLVEIGTSTSVLGIFFFFFEGEETC